MSDVEDVLSELGIRIMGRSRSRSDGHEELSAQCPYHYEGLQRDSDPSWTINAASGQHKCHGCGFSGSLEWLIQKVTGADRETARALAGSAERALSRVRSQDPWEGGRPVEVRPMTSARVRAYAEPPAEALASRRISAATAGDFGIRWSEDPCAWVLPITDPTTHKLMGIQLKGDGNRYFRNLPAGVVKSMTVFGLHNLSGSVVLVESPLDAAFISQLGYPAVASYGAEVSDLQMDLLISRCEKIVLALDNDDPGRKATNRLLGRDARGTLKNYFVDYSQRIDISVVRYETSDKDPGEMSIPDVHSLINESVSALRYGLSMAG